MSQPRQVSELGLAHCDHHYRKAHLSDTLQGADLIMGPWLALIRKSCIVSHLEPFSLANCAKNACTFGRACGTINVKLPKCQWM